MMKYFLIGTILIAGTGLACLAQGNTSSGNGGQLTTLIVRPNRNGLGVSVLDQSTNTGQVESTSGQQQQEQQVGRGTGDIGEDGELDDQVVAGLLEWLDKKKKKKKEKKEEKEKKKEDDKEKNNERPTERPTERPQERPQKKEIHIHIHIKDKDNNHKKHNKNKHGGGHYEDYHEGHHDHDKHYNGKHSWPLLGHHYNWDQDFSGGFGGFGGAGDQHSGGGFGDDYGGYESKKINNYVIEKKPIVVQRPVLVKKNDN